MFIYSKRCSGSFMLRCVTFVIGYISLVRLPKDVFWKNFFYGISLRMFFFFCWGGGGFVEWKFHVAVTCLSFIYFLFLYSAWKCFLLLGQDYFISIWKNIFMAIDRIWVTIFMASDGIWVMIIFLVDLYNLPTLQLLTVAIFMHLTWIHHYACLVYHNDWCLDSQDSCRAG